MAKRKLDHLTVMLTRRFGQKDLTEEDKNEMNRLIEKIDKFDYPPHMVLPSFHKYLLSTPDNSDRNKFRAVKEMYMRTDMLHTDKLHYDMLHFDVQMVNFNPSVNRLLTEQIYN